MGWRQKDWNPERTKYGASNILSLCPHDVLGPLHVGTFSVLKKAKGAVAQNWWLTGRSWLKPVLNLSFT